MKDSGKQRKLAAYQFLKRQVLTLALAPGQDLDEPMLCEKFELSRTPLRELCRQLAGEGYLELPENRAARVSDMSYTTLREFFLAAPMIYGAVLRLAAANAKPTQLGELKTAQKEFKVALRTGNSAERALANNRFHEITGDMAGNIYLLPSFKRLLIDHARISMTFYQARTPEMTENMAKACDHHDAMIAAIEAGDPAIAGRLAEDHWDLSRNQIELFVMPGALDVPLGSYSNQHSA
jgi:DNA-binding GntR family transcriptional regulator